MTTQEIIQLHVEREECVKLIVKYEEEYKQAKFRLDVEKAWLNNIDRILDQHAESIKNQPAIDKFTVIGNM